jgi:hypothetical protein
MNDEEIIEIYNKFVAFAKKSGYGTPIPSEPLAFMSRIGDVMKLINKKETIIIRRNDIVNAEFTEIGEV